jgi:diacylglycerol kinase family enzyme
LGRAGADAARDALEQAGFEVRRYDLTQDSQEFELTLDGHLARGEELVIVGGGDGTLRAAAERLAGTSTTLGAFPLGTGNAWAHELGVPNGPVPAAATLFKASPRLLDLGVANGHGFVNVATIGLTSLIARHVRGRKGALGRLAYLSAVVRSLREARPFHLTVESDAGRFECDAMQFVAAAGRTHAGPFPVTRHAANDDGLLSLYALHETDRRGMLRFGLALLRGRHTQLEEVWSCEAASAEVSTHPGRSVVVDGDVLCRGRLTLELRPSSLRVLVPDED